MFYTICYYFILFLLYSFLGWILENACVSITHKKFIINRGFLLGPYCPIYGFSSIIMILLLKNYVNDTIALFVLSTVLCTIIEYFTSLIMEKLFKLRWWDYSDRKFNINGRVCLEIAIWFGLLGVLLIKFVNPLFVSFLSSFSKQFILVLAIILFVIFLADIILSSIVISKLRNNVILLAKEDQTNEITKQVKISLSNMKFLTKRLLNAFPKVSFPNNTINAVTVFLNNFSAKAKEKKKKTKK